MKAFFTNLVYALLRFFHFSYRYEFFGKENLDGERNYVLAIWHQNLLQGILAQIGKPHVVIVSKSKDAQIVADVCSRLGNTVVRGSSRKGNVDKGGKVAKSSMIDVLKSGLPGAVTVDGPKGPAFFVKPGIIDMALKAGVDIVPYAPVPESFWEFNSWDKFRLPKPFSRIKVHYGRPISVQDLSFEDAQNKVKEELDLLQIKIG